MSFLLRLPLYPLSWLFGVLVTLKNWLYDSGLLKTIKLDRPVISVGNLSFGGAGKSPVVGALIDLLETQGLSVAVLSRGYGRREPQTARLVDPLGDWQVFGDEPMMLAKAHPQARVCVGPSRAAAAALLAENPPDVYLVDDGFQHRQLARDLDVVLLDMGQGLPKLFPLGLFREAGRALRRADLVLLTRSEGRDVQGFRNWISAFNKDVPVLTPSFESGALRRLTDGKLVGTDEILDRRIAAFAGIARPQKFYDALRAMGLEVVIRYSLGDHKPLDQTTRIAMLDECMRAGVKYVVTTEKDAVKLESCKDSAILFCSLSLVVSWREDGILLQIINRVTKADAW